MRGSVGWFRGEGGVGVEMWSSIWSRRLRRALGTLGENCYEKRRVSKSSRQSKLNENWLLKRSDVWKRRVPPCFTVLSGQRLSREVDPSLGLVSFSCPP